MWAGRARIGRDRPPDGPQAGSGRLSPGPAVGRFAGVARHRGKDEKKGTVGAKRRRARMEKNPGRRERRGAMGPASGQKRVRMPEVSSSWFFAPNVDAAV